MMRIKKWLSVLCALALLMGCFLMNAGAEEQAGVNPGGSEEAYGSLIIRIEGPDSRMPMEISYKEFESGSFLLEDLKAGEYTVQEIRPEALLDGYDLQEDSVTAVKVTVAENGETTASLFNHYVPETPEAEKPAITPPPGQEPEGPAEMHPEEEYISVSVRKEWDDRQNAMGLRPASVTVTLSNGSRYVLSERNGWSVTVDHLPAKVNGQPVTYTWTEREVPGYMRAYALRNGNHTTLVNRLWEQPETGKGQKEPKRAGATWYYFDDYETPLGVDIMINHVGDCYE